MGACRLGGVFSWGEIRMGRIPCGGKLPFLLWESGMCLPYSWFLPARRSPPPGRWGQAVSWRLCRLETARALWVLCRLTDGAGKTVFSFVGKWCVLSCSCFLPARQGLFIRLPGGGQNHFFFCWAKEKVVLDSEKEKVDRWKFWGGAVQQDRGPILLGCSSGKILWDILLFSAAWV